MLPDNRTKRQKNIHRMPERCRNLIPVSKGNRGNKQKKEVVVKVADVVMHIDLMGDCVSSF
jgi:hypothetical protein